MAVSITGDGFTVSLDNPSANLDATNGKYWHYFRPEGPQYDTQEVFSPGVNSAASRNGFRGRTLRIGALYVAASFRACLADIAADESCCNKAAAVSDGSTSYPACECKNIRILDGPQATGYGKYMALVEFEFKQLRTV